MYNKNNSESYLSINEIKELLASINDTRDKLMLSVLYETGCEMSELTDIRVEDLLGNKIRVGLHEKRFPIISSKLAKDLREFIKGNKLEKNNFLFSTRQSNKISEKRVRQLIQDYSQKHIVKMNPQMFRYFHILHAYLNGVYLENISNQIGITKYRIFQILSRFNIKPRQNLYNNFLKKV